MNRRRDRIDGFVGWAVLVAVWAANAAMAVLIAAWLIELTARN